MGYTDTDEEEELDQRKPYGSPALAPASATDGYAPADTTPQAPVIGGDYAPAVPKNPVSPHTPGMDTGPSLNTAMTNTIGQRPNPKDYQPAKPSIGKRIALAMAAFGGPETGSIAARNIFDRPAERAQSDYAAANSAYDTNFNQQLGLARESREGATAQSEAELRGAQAKQFDMVEINIPGHEEPVMVPRKDVGRIQQAIEANKSHETIASGHDTTKVETTDATNQSREKIAKDKAAVARQPIRVMGDKTYEKQADGAWKEIGAAPARTEPGNYSTINDETGATVGWVNPKSGHMIKVDEIPGLSATTGGSSIPVKPTGATKSRQDQAQAIDRASEGLIKTITAHRDKIGNVEAILKSAFLNTPVGDPELAGVASEIASYAALQPAMHGFKGQDALHEFMKMIGGLPKNPDALIASIRGIQKTAGYIQPPKKNATETVTPPVVGPGGAPKTAEEYFNKKKTQQKGTTP